VSGWVGGVFAHGVRTFFYPGPESVAGHGFARRGRALHRADGLLDRFDNSRLRPNAEDVWSRATRRLLQPRGGLTLRSRFRAQGGWRPVPSRSRGGELRVQLPRGSRGFSTCDVRPGHPRPPVPVRDQGSRQKTNPVPGRDVHAPSDFPQVQARTKGLSSAGGFFLRIEIGGRRSRRPGRARKGAAWLRTRQTRELRRRRCDRTSPDGTRRTSPRWRSTTHQFLGRAVPGSPEGTSIDGRTSREEITIATAQGPRGSRRGRARARGSREEGWTGLVGRWARSGAC